MNTAFEPRQRVGEVRADDEVAETILVVELKGREAEVVDVIVCSSAYCPKPNTPKLSGGKRFEKPDIPQR